MRRLTLAHVFHGILTAVWWLIVVGVPIQVAVFAATAWRQLTVPVRVPDRAVASGVAVADVVGAVDASTLADGPELAVIGLWAVSALVWLPVVSLLRRFTGSVLRDGPFREPAVRLLPWIGGALIAVALLSEWLSYAMSRVAAVGGLEAMAVEPDGGLMLAGFVVIGLGEVFRHGQGLQRADDLTV